MAVCIYCGKKAGIFSEYHKECRVEAEQNRDIGLQNIRDHISSAINENDIEKHPYPQLLSDLNEIVAKHKLSPEVVRQAVIPIVDELSREEPLEPVKAEYLWDVCRDLARSETLSPDNPSYYPCQRTLLGHLKL